MTSCNISKIGAARSNYPIKTMRKQRVENLQVVLSFFLPYSSQYFFLGSVDQFSHLIQQVYLPFFKHFRSYLSCNNSCVTIFIRQAVSVLSWLFLTWQRRTTMGSIYAAKTITVNRKNTTKAQKANESFSVLVSILLSMHPWRIGATIVRTSKSTSSSGSLPSTFCNTACTWFYYKNTIKTS